MIIIRVWNIYKVIQYYNKLKTKLGTQYKNKITDKYLKYPIFTVWDGML